MLGIDWMHVIWYAYTCIMLKKNNRSKVKMKKNVIGATIISINNSNGTSHIIKIIIIIIIVSRYASHRAKKINLDDITEKYIVYQS